jgi:hypothetical protein
LINSHLAIQKCCPCGVGALSMTNEIRDEQEKTYATPAND